MILEGTITIQGWQEAAYDESAGEIKLSRAEVRQAYSGAVEGEAALQFMMCYAAGGTVPFVGMERITGRVGEREGSFVIQHVGAYGESGSRAAVTILPGSGAGALAGIAGRGDVIWDGAHGEPGRYRLDVELAG